MALLSMDVEILISHLSKRKEETEDILKFVKEWPQNGYSYISKLGKFAIRYAEIRLKSELKWIEESVEILKSNNLPEGQDPHGDTHKQRMRRRNAVREMQEE